MSVGAEQRIELAHLALTAHTWGTPGLPPLLALHGWLDNAGSFALLAPLLARHFHVIALELPGHGHADHLPAAADYHPAGYVRTVLEALDALALPRVTLLGHSLGAGIASMVAAARPERIAALRLIEGLGLLADDGSHTLERFREALAAPGDSKPPRVFRDAEAAALARSQASDLAPALALPIARRSLVATAGGWRWRSDARLLRRSPLRLAESQVRALLAGIAAPTRLLLASPATRYLPEPLLRERAACVPHLAVRHLAGGHHLHLEHPAEVADWLLAADD